MASPSNGNGSRLWAVMMFLAALVAGLAAAYVRDIDMEINDKTDRLEDRLERRLDAIERKVDRLLSRNP